MKKMRKLIPAFAMLLVSAIMMSTASFAWFSMNEEVTATGMEIQAKAAGNLLISTAPMTAADQEVEVEALLINVQNNRKVNLTPITWTDNGQTKEWQIPNDAAVVDPLYGNLTGGALEKYTATDDQDGYFAEYVVYLATAGDALEACDVMVNIQGVAGVDQKIAPAYTIAFWVIAQNANGEYDDVDWNAPTHVLNYKDGKNVETKITEEAERVTIPTTYGAGVDSKVGVKVVMRVFVDGNLVEKSETTNVTKYNNMSAANTWGEFKTANAEFDPTADELYLDGAKVDVATYEEGTAMASGTYTYVDADAPTEEKTETRYYVNNQYIPTASTTFDVIFSVDDNPTQQAAGN